MLVTIAIVQDHVPKHGIGHVGSGNMKVSKEISDAILKKMGYKFNPEEFHMGINVEMEHQDVTNGNIVKTAKIAAAHLTEKPNYYTLLKKYVEKKKDEQLVGPGGSINAAPKPQDVKKMRKALDSEK